MSRVNKRSAPLTSLCNDDVGQLRENEYLWSLLPQLFHDNRKCNIVDVLKILVDCLSALD